MKCERKEGTPPELFECAKCGRPFKLQPHGIGLPVHRECIGPMGFGDYVAAAIHVTGIGPLYYWLRGGNCGGCSARHAALNDLGKKMGL